MTIHFHSTNDHLTPFSSLPSSSSEYKSTWMVATGRFYLVFSARSRSCNFKFNLKRLDCDGCGVEIFYFWAPTELLRLDTSSGRLQRFLQGRHKGVFRSLSSQKPKLSTPDWLIICLGLAYRREVRTQTSTREGSSLISPGNVEALLKLPRNEKPLLLHKLKKKKPTPF